jgi:hypothetical protein
VGGPLRGSRRPGADQTRAHGRSVLWQEGYKPSCDSCTASVHRAHSNAAYRSRTGVRRRERNVDPVASEAGGPSEARARRSCPSRRGEMNSSRSSYDGDAYAIGGPHRLRRP